MKPLGPFRHWKHMLRYRQVANALAHHGFDLMFGRAQRRGDGAPLNGVVSAAPEHLRRTLEELGPTFVKLGQLLSTRPDLISREYIKELEKLQDHVPPFPYEQVRQVLAEEGVDVDLHFAHLEPEPFASASIGQVHEGVLRSGERVVVKVQRPGIQQVVETDLEILYELAQLAERRTGWGKLYRITDIVREFAQALRKEMDFAQEGRNADKFRRNFAGSETVLIPRVFWHVTTPRVLVLEYVGGVKVSDVEALKAAGYDLTRVAAHVVEALFHQIYTHGFFHADPHPGNLAVTEGEKIIFYDFGQVGTID
ncbi:MAG: AarF/UbiB family protein, partial [Syntrophomonadaceae bacterium]|nr:AarF/UbiB family protein [Syntrophomonadaceae bacterium]